MLPPIPFQPPSVGDQGYDIGRFEERGLRQELGFRKKSGLSAGGSLNARNITSARRTMPANL